MRSLVIEETVVFAPTKRMVILPNWTEIAFVRMTFGRWLCNRGVGDIDRADLVLVVSELTTNAIEASPANVAVEIAMEHEHDSIRVTVSNCGPSPPSLSRSYGDFVLRERGRGLQIVETLTESLRSDYDPPVTTVSCLRHLVA